MKIVLNASGEQTPFCRKDKSIREADRLQRQAKLSFPVMSSTYVDSFYSSLDKNSKRRDTVAATNRDLANRIYDMRDDFSYAERLANYNRFDKKMMYILDKISKIRAGNCIENARLALAVLCANGYYNSSLVGLKYTVQFINKETKEVEYKQSTALDHAFVITDMNQRGKKDIILDPWLGFADYEQEAFAKFKVLFGEDLDDLLTMHKKLFRIEKVEKGEMDCNEQIDFDKYEIRKGFSYIENYDDNGSIEEKKNLGALVKEEYPSVVLNVVG